MAGYLSLHRGNRLSGAEIEQLLDGQRQQVLVLATLRETTDDQLDDEEFEQAEDGIRIVEGECAGVLC